MRWIDVALDGPGNDEEDHLPALNETSTPVTQPGDLWLLGEHRILCADALMGESYARLLGDERAQMVFTDPPWNIPIAGHVSGLGAITHDDFAMGCGEMSSAEFEAFLHTALGHAATYSDDGAIHFVCMHWAKIRELLDATAALYSDTKNLCVWSKTNAGMGSLYRSRHELVFVFKKGTAPHINNVELGRFGRNRSNVWEYAGQNVLNGTSKSKLSVHPTAKPVALVADAIRDCSHTNGIILDSFGGSGTTLIAAMLAAGRALGVEIMIVECRSDSDFEAAFEKMVRGGAEALILDTLPLNNLDRVVSLAAFHKIPAMYPFRWLAQAGGLMSYDADIISAARRLGSAYVGRILKGEKPADIPVEQPTKFDLVINMKTAKALGLTIPRTLLALADEVIE